MNSSKYLNREISWLYFNGRVLQEASDERNPLLERLKFLGIYSSNLDEFFSVRVGSLMRLIALQEESDIQYDFSPQAVLTEVQQIVLQQKQDFEEIFNSITRQLMAENVYFIDENNLSESQKQFVFKYFRNKVRPRLIPIMLSKHTKFPYLKNLTNYLAIYLQKTTEPDAYNYAIIEIPVDVLPRFLVLPSEDDRQYVIMLDDVIRLGLNDTFSILSYDKFSAYTIKITRDAEIDISDEVTISFFEKMNESIEQRKYGTPVRLVYDEKIPDHFLEYILKKMDLKDFKNLIPGSRYHNARDFISFPNLGGKNLRYKKQLFLPSKNLISDISIFDQLKEKDVLLHFPYHSFHHVIDLLREAAIDPQVKEIKMTLYRVAKKSSVVNALINAVYNGKKVTVLLELQARFDEEANLYWTEQLEKAGARIIFGMPGMKVHSKLCLISRKERKVITYYAIIGTGNFNESTARIYTDHALFTCDQSITKEVANVFSFLEDNYKSFNYINLLVAPFTLRKKLYKFIRAEIKAVQNGETGFIYAKLNSLVDRKIINKLYKASSAGVEIKLLVRGICSLIPGVKGLSENIEVRSILDRYLEHSRIYIFGNKGDTQVYISSADWMDRNLSRRIEVAVPILSPAIKQELLAYFDLQWRDNVKARLIDLKRSNRYVNKEPDETPVQTQLDMYDLISQHE
jgi:polyphosphate kinase